MKHCRDCGNEVSESAPRCPYCGAIDPGSSEKQMSQFRTWIALIIIIYIVGNIILYFLSTS